MAVLNEAQLSKDFDSLYLAKGILIFTLPPRVIHNIAFPVVLSIYFAQKTNEMFNINTMFVCLFLTDAHDSELLDQFQGHEILMTSCKKTYGVQTVINNIEERKMQWRYIMKTCKLHLPIVPTLEITKIIDFNQADYTCYYVCCYYFVT